MFHMLGPQHRRQEDGKDPRRAMRASVVVSRMITWSTQPPDSRRVMPRATDAARDEGPGHRRRSATPGRQKSGRLKQIAALKNRSHESACTLPPLHPERRLEDSRRPGSARSRS